jgi:hypothetical protein
MNKLFRIVFAFVVVALVYYSMEGDKAKDHEKYVRAERAKKEDYLRTGSESPFVKAGKKMDTLRYFPIDKSYQVTTRVELVETRQPVRLGNSDGTVTNYLRYAWLHFKLHDQEHKLVVLKQQFGVGYFLAFTDGTSGETTYGGGRYLDIGEIKGDRYTLDFNLAYNPYCAYSSEYTCPLPPKENSLSVQIAAGEMDYGK